MAKQPGRRVEDPRIRQLENDLYLVRRALINLVPEPAREVLGSYWSIKSEQDWFRWESHAAEQIADMAENVVQRTDHGYAIEAPRAKCPLCHAGPQSYYENDAGFAWPEGLIRHLTSAHIACQCPVFGAAFALALNYVRDPTFGPVPDP